MTQVGIGTKRSVIKIFLLYTALGKRSVAYTDGVVISGLRDGHLHLTNPIQKALIT